MLCFCKEIEHLEALGAEKDTAGILKYFLLPDYWRKRCTTNEQKAKKIVSQDDYEKSSFKSIAEDMEDTKNNALESAVPKVKKRMPSDNETSKEILYGEAYKDNSLKKPQANTKKEKII